MALENLPISQFSHAPAAAYVPGAHAGVGAGVVVVVSAVVAVVVGAGVVVVALGAEVVLVVVNCSVVVVVVVAWRKNKYTRS